MKDYELLEKQAAMMRMAEKYGVDDWRKLVKAHIIGDTYETIANYSDDKLYPEGVYKFALGVVEGRAVFEGDKLYYPPVGAVRTISHVAENWEGELSFYSFENACLCKVDDPLLTWNPPAPKTVMVELLVEDAEMLQQYVSWCKEENRMRVNAACRKALEGLK